MTFSIYLCCHLLVSFGAWLTLIGIVSELSSGFASSLPVAGLLIAKRLPTGFGYPLGGILASRPSVPQALALCYLTSVILLVIMAWFVSDISVHLWLLIASYALLAGIDGLIKPLSKACLSVFTREPVRIKKFNDLMNVASVVGMFSAGITIVAFKHLITSPGILCFNAATCLIAALILYPKTTGRVADPVPRPATIENLPSSALPCSITINCLYGLLMLIISQYPVRFFHIAASLSGVLYTCAAFSALCGALVYCLVESLSVQKRVKQQWRSASSVVMLLSFCLLSQTTGIGTAAVTLAFCLVPFYFLKLNLESVVLQSTSVGQHGRVLAQLFIAEEVFIGVGILWGAFLLDRSGEPGVLVAGLSLCGSGILLGVVQQRHTALKFCSDLKARLLAAT